MGFACAQLILRFDVAGLADDGFRVRSNHPTVRCSGFEGKEIGDGLAQTRHKLFEQVRMGAGSFENNLVRRFFVYQQPIWFDMTLPPVFVIA